MKKYYESEEFNKTQEEWYARLKATGFRDVEYKSEKEGQFCKMQVFDANLLKQQYYDKCLDLAAKKCNDKTIFKTPDEFKIYLDHAKGLNLREIQETLAKKISLVAIWKTIQRVNNRAGLKI